MGGVSTTIMAHPAREHHVLELQKLMPEANTVWDERNDRWDTGRRAMLDYNPDHDWHLVVQDDAILCRDFLPGVAAALEHVPEVPVSFYTGKTRPYASEVVKSVKRAQLQGKNWMSMRGPLWGVAIALPTRFIEDMVKDCDMRDVPNYDMRMSEYFYEQQIDCWYSLPSLVNHRVGSKNPSLVPGRGSSPKRTAHMWIGDISPLHVDWSTGAYAAGDPSEPWRFDDEDNYVCTSCYAKTTSLRSAILHAHAEHEFEKVDFLAATPGNIRIMDELRASLPAHLRGTLWIAGKDFARYTSTPMEAVRVERRNDMPKIMMTEEEVFTIVGNFDNLNLVKGRAAWALDGTAN